MTRLMPLMLLAGCLVRLPEDVVPTPDNSNGLEVEWSDVASGLNHTCVLDPDGFASCWGSNEYGELDAPEGQAFIDIAAGDYVTCGLTVPDENTGSNAIKCWGLGQLNSPNTPQSRPDNPFEQISLGRRLACVRSGPVASGSNIQCWGDIDGQYNPPDGNFRSVSAAGNAACAARSVGSVKCWGGSHAGNHSDNEAGGIVDLSIATEWGLGIDDQGVITSWGDVPNGFNIPDGEWADVALGEDTACAIGFDGTLNCFGRNKSLASQYDAELFTQIDAGPTHVCGITETGVKCWGGDTEIGQATVPEEFGGGTPAE